MILHAAGYLYCLSQLYFRFPSSLKVSNMSDPLNAASLLGLLPTLLPQGTTSPLPLSTDAIAALVHAIHTALQFRLVSPAPQPVDDNSKLEQPRSGGDNDDAMSEVTAVEQEDNSQPPIGRLAEGWNSRGEDSYSFQYRHDQSAMNFRVRVGKMGNRVQIDAMAEVSVSALNVSRKQWHQGPDAYACVV